MIPYLNMQSGLKSRYGLKTTEECAVLSAVMFFCREAPHTWKRNAKQISDGWDFMPSPPTVRRILIKLIKIGAVKADGCMLTVHNERKNAQNERTNAQNERYIINNNINNNSCLAGNAATPQPQQDIFIVPSFEELLSYGRERGYDFKEMKKYYQYYSGNGWTLKRGAKMKSWPATLGFWMSRAEEKKACAAAAKFATLAQAGFRPENRSFEHACAMKSRAADAQAIASAKKEAELLSDEDRQANFELISRLSKKFCTTI